MPDLPDVLLLNPVTEALDAELSARFMVHRYHAAADAEALLATVGGKVRAVVAGGHIGLPAHIAEALPALEIAAINGVGYDAVDMDRARTCGYRVAITPDVLTDDVADLALALTLNLVRRVNDGDAFVRSGQWSERSFGLSRSIGSLRFGIYGMGKIGQAVARRLVGFDAVVEYTSRSAKEVPLRFHPGIVELANAVDVLILTAASTAETRRSINAEVLDALGPNGYVVNIARGALLDQALLMDYLRDGKIAGAALDVFEVEPLLDPQALTAPNLVLTPHIGSATEEARRAMARSLLENLDAHFAGRSPPGLV